MSSAGVQSEVAAGHSFYLRLTLTRATLLPARRPTRLNEKRIAYRSSSISDGVQVDVVNVGIVLPRNQLERAGIAHLRCRSMSSVQLSGQKFDALSEFAKSTERYFDSSERALQ